MQCTAVRTYEEVAAELGITKAGVMQIEKRALQKLKRELRRIDPEAFHALEERQHGETQ